MSLKVSLQELAANLEAVPQNQALKVLSATRTKLIELAATLPDEPLTEQLPIFPDEEFPV